MLKDNYIAHGSNGLRAVVGGYGEGASADSTTEILEYYYSLV